MKREGERSKKKWLRHKHTRINSRLCNELAVMMAQFSLGGILTSRYKTERKMNHVRKNNRVHERSSCSSWKCSTTSLDVPARCSAVPVHGVLVIGQRRIEALPREMFRGKKKKKEEEEERKTEQFEI